MVSCAVRRGATAAAQQQQRDDEVRQPMLGAVSSHQPSLRRRSHSRRAQGQRKWPLPDSQPRSRGERGSRRLTRRVVACGWVYHTAIIAPKRSKPRNLHRASVPMCSQWPGANATKREVLAVASRPLSGTRRSRRCCGGSELVVGSIISRLGAGVRRRFRAKQSCIGMHGVHLDATRQPQPRTRRAWRCDQPHITACRGSTGPAHTESLQRVRAPAFKRR